LKLGSSKEETASNYIARKIANSTTIMHHGLGVQDVKGQFLQSEVTTAMAHVQQLEL